MVEIFLCYKKFFKILLLAGLKLNPYDTCVANRMVNKKQQTNFWHVESCKLIHMDQNTNDKLIEWLKQEYEIIFEDGSGKLNVNRGKTHKHLGITMD